MATHQLQPTAYWHTLGTHPAALHAADGDTIIAATVDAYGHDAADVAVTARGNPMTGPVFVEGTAPGDALAVEIVRITPTRLRAKTRGALSPQVVVPEVVNRLPDRAHVYFQLDLDAGRATLIDPPSPRLNGFSVPIQPMIGCFGVAPGGDQAISTATSGTHGGNMDWKGFGVGATAIFPVAVEGALFFLGDVHAWQADGEITGAGLEVSAEVEVRVRVLKGKGGYTVRGENADFIFTLGNARPLDLALQIATADMLVWLQTDYGFDAASAGLFLGSVVRYEVGNVFDPAYTMVCKVAKAALG